MLWSRFADERSLSNERDRQIRGAIPQRADILEPDRDVRRRQLGAGVLVLKGEYLVLREWRDGRTVQVET